MIGLQERPQLGYQADNETVFRDAQCDEHLREKNIEAAKTQSESRDQLVNKLSSFVQHGDQKLDTVAFAEVVAARLLEWAIDERARRIGVCPDGFEHLLRSEVTNVAAAYAYRAEIGGAIRKYGHDLRTIHEAYGSPIPPTGECIGAMANAWATCRVAFARADDRLRQRQAAR